MTDITRAAHAADVRTETRVAPHPLVEVDHLSIRFPVGRSSGFRTPPPTSALWSGFVGSRQERPRPPPPRERGSSVASIRIPIAG